MANESYRGAGRVLAEAWLAAKTIDLPTDLLPVDRDEAYATQDEMVGVLAVDAKNKVVGWKVGATSSGVQEAEGYDGPIPGRVIASTIYKNCSSIPASRCQGAKVEAEIAFRFVTAPQQQNNGFNQEYLARIVTVLSAFDITSTRYAPTCRAGWDSRQNMLAGIADNGNGGVVVLGAEASLREGLDLMHLRVDLRVNDGDPAPNLWGKSRGDPLEALAWTVNHVYERGFAVAAGDVVLTGSLTEPQPLQPRDKVRCRMPGIGSLSCQISLA